MKLNFEEDISIYGDPANSTHRPCSDTFNDGCLKDLKTISPLASKIQRLVTRKRSNKSKKGKREEREEDLEEEPEQQSANTPSTGNDDSASSGGGGNGCGEDWYMVLNVYEAVQNIQFEFFYPYFLDLDLSWMTKNVMEYVVWIRSDWS